MDLRYKNHIPAQGASEDKFPARNSISRSSLMQVGTSSKQRIPFETKKPGPKGFSDMSYSMNRWLDEKPSEEPWHGLRKQSQWSVL
jgi:hypothetical protein